MLPVPDSDFSILTHCKMASWRGRGGGRLGAAVNAMCPGLEERALLSGEHFTERSCGMLMATPSHSSVCYAMVRVSDMMGTCAAKPAGKAPAAWLVPAHPKHN